MDGDTTGGMGRLREEGDFSFFHRKFTVFVGNRLGMCSRQSDIGCGLNIQLWDLWHKAGNGSLRVRWGDVKCVGAEDRLGKCSL